MIRCNVCEVKVYEHEARREPGTGVEICIECETKLREEAAATESGSYRSFNYALFRKSETHWMLCIDDEYLSGGDFDTKEQAIQALQRGVDKLYVEASRRLTK